MTHTNAQKRTLSDLYSYGINVYIDKGGKLRHLSAPRMDLPSVMVVSKNTALNGVTLGEGASVKRLVEAVKEIVDGEDNYKGLSSRNDYDGLIEDICYDLSDALAPFVEVANDS